MLNPTEAISHWIDAQPEGALIRSLDLERLVNRNQASRALARLAQRGRLMRVARGMYVAVTVSRFGPVPPPVNKVVQSLARITGHSIVRHGAAAANALGLTTQVSVRQIYLTDGCARTLNFGKQVIEIRRALKWMLMLGDSTAGDVVRALEWLGPDLAEQAIGKLDGRIGQDDWGAVLEARAHLPTWMVVAIQNGLAASKHVPFCR
ncbi:DUF6088 family protein [Stenotrophomonas sp. Sm2017]|uniref:DUF6088 family protein n=1 Tax=Stenotrophomonas sp. Sm2017 TaxID=3002747 RepID=UPI0027E5B958|nr:DUF6088 family protein [Stenotrophomonas sp. Sm2017]MDQ7300449.1 DUF6088 family protein [Stenotrophomonas sp. Sm2017]